MKVILGGTFDPVHIGHLRIATELVAALDVECVDLMPCFEAVHKDGVSATAEQRFEMLSLSTKDDEYLSIDDRELCRKAPSYTIDSLRQLRAELHERPLCIVMGTDSAMSLASWYCAKEFSSLTHVVVVQRPGEQSGGAGSVEEHLQRLGFAIAGSAKELHSASSGLGLALELTQLEISSTAIRKAVKENKSIRYLVKGAVERYICDNGLYRI